MAKAKNKRNSGLADKVHSKRKGEVFKKKLNPFEVHINKEKLKVLGKKSKHDRGLPGVSRAKAIQKRKETLGTEMKLINKTNAFIDRRIGEKNTQLSAEDRIVARFAAERAKQHTKKNIYNLADDEILTHRGQTLEQIEKFDDPRSSDDDDDGDGKKFGGLDNEFVSEGHFGGGVLSRTKANDGAKSHKDLIEQLIAESKKRKAEKQKEKEQTLDLTEKLDSEWQDLKPVVLKKARVEEKEETLIDKLLNQAERKSADYDKMMRELRFEKRGTPSDGLKSEEKQAKEEKQKLEQLERDREQRMLGEEENGNSTKILKPTTKHRSAEDLEDNFELEDEQNFMLAYDKDGNPLVPDYVFKANNVPNSKKFQDGISDSSSDDGEDDHVDDDVESSDDEENENDDQTQNGFINSDNNKNIESIKNKIVKKNENSILFNHKSSDDEENDESSDADTVEEKPTKKSVPEKKNPVLPVNNEIVESQQITKVSDSDKDEQSSADGESSDEEDIKEIKEQTNFDDMKHLESGQENEEEIDAAADADRITSFFNPSSTEGYKLKELLTGKSPAQQSAAIQKLIKSYDPSLGEKNKDLLSKLFVYLLQYINDTFSNLKKESEVIKSFLIFDKIAPHLYDLAQTNKVSTKKYLVEVLTEKHDEFRNNTKKVPDLEILIFFKLVSLIYPTSDFRHPVTTPSLVFMSEILNLSRYQDVYSISRGLFITALILEYTVLSKRLVPSAINFLRGILYLTANTSILNPIQVVPPFRLHRDEKILKLDDDCSKMVAENKMAAKDLVRDEADSDYKIRCLSTCVDMLREYFDHFNDIEAQGCLFEPHLQLLSRIDLDLYPKKIANRISETIKYMQQNLEVKTYTPMAREKKMPKALRLYEPDVQEVFTGNKSYKLSREKAEQSKLQHKYKKEMKGALREIRRDKAFIANVKIRHKIQSDNIRKEKVKQIFKDASIQQGELNKLKRMK